MHFIREERLRPISEWGPKFCPVPQQQEQTRKGTSDNDDGSKAMEVSQKVQQQVDAAKKSIRSARKKAPTSTSRRKKTPMQNALTAPGTLRRCVDLSLQFSGGRPDP